MRAGTTGADRVAASPSRTPRSEPTAASAPAASAPVADAVPTAAPAVSAPPLRCPHLEELRAFCAAADLHSIGRAAQRLHLTQPAISRRVQSLERVVGTALLTRSAHGVELTAAGERLYARARKLLCEADELTAALGEVRGASTVRLAISHTAAECLMPQALVTMRRSTSAAVEVIIANSRVVKAMLAAEQADVGVAACMREEVVPRLVNVPLLDDEIEIAVPLAHRWARRREISPAELTSTRVVLRDPGAHTRQVIDETLREHGLRPLSAACEVGSTLAAKRQAHEMGLPTALSRLTLSPADRLEPVSVTGLRFRRRFCVLHAEDALTRDGGHLLAAFAAAADGSEPT